MQNRCARRFLLPIALLLALCGAAIAGITRTSSFRSMGNMPPPRVVSKCRCHCRPLEWSG